MKSFWNKHIETIIAIGYGLLIATSIVIFGYFFIKGIFYQHQTDTTDQIKSTPNSDNGASTGCSYEGCVEDEIDRQQYEDWKNEQIQSN